MRLHGPYIQPYHLARVTTALFAHTLFVLCFLLSFSVCVCGGGIFIYSFFFFVFMFLCFLSAFSLWGRRGHGFILAMSSSFSSISGPYTRMAGELTRWLDKQRSKGIFQYHDSIELKNFPSRVISTICRTIAGIWLKQLSVGLHHSPEPERLVN